MSNDGWETFLWVIGAAWVFATGASVGSFLNVVVHRLPRGLSLVSPPSRCPRCLVPIRPLDNLPVLGWLKLRGKCRACGQRISPRYPLVELTCGLLFLGLACMELAPPPSASPRTETSSLRNDYPAMRPLSPLNRYPVERFAFHVILVTVLFTCALLATDDVPFPGRAETILMIAAFVLIAGLSFASATKGAAARSGVAATVPMFRGLEGVTVALVLSVLIGKLLGPRMGKLDVPFALSWLGLFLGWKGAVLGGIIAFATGWSLKFLRGVSQPESVGQFRNIIASASVAWALFASGLLAVWWLPLVTQGLALSSKF